MLRLRQIPSVRSPVSASLSMRIICSVARLVFFSDDVLSLIDENHLIKSGLVRGVPTTSFIGGCRQPSLIGHNVGNYLKKQFKYHFASLRL